MVAPGDMLEFEKGPKFERVEIEVPGITDAVMKQYSDRPNEMVNCSPVLKKGEVKFGGKTYEFLLRRRGPTRVYLLMVVEVENGVGIAEDELKYFIQLFKGKEGNREKA